MRDTILLKKGQKIRIKPFDQCLEEGYIFSSDEDAYWEFDEDRYWEFENVKNNPGASKSMTKYFGGIYTFLSYSFDYYVLLKEIPRYVWPIEVLDISMPLSKLKIL